MQNYDDFLMEVYESREKMVADPHRERHREVGDGCDESLVIKE